MKVKKILFAISATLLFYLAYPQDAYIQHKFYATSEEDAYRLYNRLLDSTRLSSICLYPGQSVDLNYGYLFGFSYLEAMNGIDTILKVERLSEDKAEDFKMSNYYDVYISGDMPIDFYERFFEYLKSLDIRDNYCIRKHLVKQFPYIEDIVIKQYESGTLNKQDSIKARLLIERLLIGSITKTHVYWVINKYDSKYMTDNIRKALINVIEHPFYPTEYLDVFLSYQDTLCLDTVGIPDTTKAKYEYSTYIIKFYPEEVAYYERLRMFFGCEKEGQQQGLSPGQAYLKWRSEFFIEKGYLPINEIAEYAHKKQDKLLIKHLKEFKKKHPDYPLKYF